VKKWWEAVEEKRRSTHLLHPSRQTTTHQCAVKKIIACLGEKQQVGGSSAKTKSGGAR